MHITNLWLYPIIIDMVFFFRRFNRRPSIKQVFHHNNNGIYEPSIWTHFQIFPPVNRFSYRGSPFGLAPPMPFPVSLCSFLRPLPLAPPQGGLPPPAFCPSPLVRPIRIFVAASFPVSLVPVFFPPLILPWLI